jgi:formylglycine-generating enzyme required for sulfatase activity
LALATAGNFSANLHWGRAAPAPVGQKTQFTNSIGMKLVRIKPGKFKMGSPAGEVGRRNEELQHEVEITRAYYLGVFHVTQAQYQKIMGTNPSCFAATGSRKESVGGLKTADFPVEAVCWKDAVAFCAKLSATGAERKAGRVYRLPTEAEWEYACRAGTTTPFHFGKSASSTQANFDGNKPYGDGKKGPSLNRTSKVGSYKPNAWGLYDMHGNVWQFCSDWHDANYYRASPKKDPKGPATGSNVVVRGAGYLYEADWCRSAFRLGVGPTAKWDHVGFRVACDIGRR